MRNTLSAISIFLLIAFGLSGCANQQNPNNNGNPSAVASAEPTPDKAAIEAQLKALEYDWPRIWKERDGAAVRKLEADDVVILSPDGSEGNKEGDIRDIESGEMSNEPQEISDVSVNVLSNDLAVVKSRTTVKGDSYVLSGGKDGKCETVIHEFRTVDTFMRRNGQWQIVSSATVPVRSPGPAAAQSPTPTEAAPSNATPAKPSPVTKGSPAKAGPPTGKPTPP
jgi:ketosteroid isomerase-like protein